MTAGWDRAALAAALRAVGVREGDVVFSHSNIAYFGYPEEGRTPETAFETVLDAFRDVLGEGGTLVVPTFTLSFTKDEVFDPWETAGFCGLFTEMLRVLPEAHRSTDPMFSVAAVGARAEELTSDVSHECFGEDSFWDRFLAADGVVCNLNLDAASTFLHHVEWRLRVPYRFDKLFCGRVVADGTPRKRGAVFYCQDASNPDTIAYFERFDELARERGEALTASVGRGAVVGIRARGAVELVADEIGRDPWFLTEAHRSGRTPVLSAPFDEDSLRPLDATSTMSEIVEALWDLPRELVSDGYDVALMSLAKAIDLQVHRYPTGTHCWTWIVPEKWTCRSARLLGLAGETLIDTADSPLHVQSYSLPFSGTVAREELLEHLHVHPHLPDAVPYVFKPYERSWGLCCPRVLRDGLADEEYQVEIDTVFSFGELKVGEHVLPGSSRETVVLCAHLCHTAMTNDDVVGVAVAVEVMRRLAERVDRRFTYRLLVVPETIGSLAWLSHNEDLIGDMVGGLFLEMLGRDAPFALQRSFTGETPADRSFVRTLADAAPDAYVGAFRTVIQNDENQFNAPGVRVPMLSLSRVDSAGSEHWPYLEYHSSADDLTNVSADRLEEAAELVVRMLEEFEERRYVANRFRGEVFASRYGVHVDFYENPAGNARLFDVIQTVDGTLTAEEIAERAGLTLEECSDILGELERCGLIEYAERPTGGWR